MTVVVGIRCTDGVVIGTDSAMTFGPSEQQLTIEQPYRSKIDIIDSHIIVAGTGQIGLGQRLASEVEKLWGEIFSPTRAWARLESRSRRIPLTILYPRMFKRGSMEPWSQCLVKRKLNSSSLAFLLFSPSSKLPTTGMHLWDQVRWLRTRCSDLFARCFGVIPRRKGKMEYSQQRWCLNWLAICPRLALLLPFKWPSSHRIIRAN